MCESSHTSCRGRPQPGVLPGSNSCGLFQSSGSEGILRRRQEDFPGGPVVKNPPADTGDTGLIPDLGRSHMLRGN